MVITLTGNDFAIKQALRAVTDRFVADFGWHGYQQVDGALFEPAALPNLLQGVSLFTTRRLVVLKDAAKNKPLWEALGNWVARVPAETTLVVVEPDLDKRTKTYKSLRSGSDFKDLALPSDDQLVGWLQDYAKKLGAKI